MRKLFLRAREYGNVATAKMGLFGLLARAIAGALARVRRSLGSSHYRPEQHYMRGPGPKTREKTGRDGGARA